MVTFKKIRWVSIEQTSYSKQLNPQLLDTSTLSHYKIKRPGLHQQKRQHGNRQLQLQIGRFKPFVFILYEFGKCRNTVLTSFGRKFGKLKKHSIFNDCQLMSSVFHATRKQNNFRAVYVSELLFLHRNRYKIIQ